MAETHLYDGGAFGRVRHSTATLVQQAELLGVGQGRLTKNDKAGTTAVQGQMDYAIDQDDCSQPILFRGFVGDQEYRRGAEAQGPAREIDLVLEDLNSIAGFQTFTGEDAASGDRPDESVDDRMAWLEASGMLPGVAFGSRVASSSAQLEKNNFADQTPSDVLGGCALAASYNVYIRDFGDGPELVFRDDNTSAADTSSIEISNRAGDADWSTVFPPMNDFILSKRPGRVGSVVRFSYANGRITEDRPETAEDFNGRRDLTASDSSVKTAAAARIRAKALLGQHSTEERIIEGSVLLPADKAGLLAHGDRVGIRLEHLTPEGFYDADELVYCRVLETRIRSLLKPTRLYEVGLRLSPQETPPGPDTCSDLFDDTPAGTYYPLGSPTPGTGAFPNPSDGVVYYFRSGLSLPAAPTPGWMGAWHFSNLGVGGVGSADYAGSCTLSRLIFMSVGNGTWTIKTEAGGTARQLGVRRGAYGNFATNPALAVISPGDSIEVEISDATEGDCVRFVQVTDDIGVCGGYWGWSEATWDPA